MTGFARHAVWALVLWQVTGATAVAADGSVLRVESRPGVSLALYWAPVEVAERTSAAHLTDVRAAVDAVRERSSAPVWLVGTSRGTVSATAAAIALPPTLVSGVVLTASLVNMNRPGALMQQELSAIRLPVLVVHHARDACGLCRPADVPWLLRGLTNAPVKKLLMLDGGGDPRGPVCEALHWHGFVGMEKDTVEAIGGWIARPVN